MVNTPDFQVYFECPDLSGEFIYQIHSRQQLDLNLHMTFEIHFATRTVNGHANFIFYPEIRINGADVHGTLNFFFHVEDEDMEAGSRLDFNFNGVGRNDLRATYSGNTTQHDPGMEPPLKVSLQAPSYIVDLIGLSCDLHVPAAGVDSGVALQIYSYGS